MWAAPRRPNYILWGLLGLSLLLHLTILWRVGRHLKPRHWMYVPVKLSPLPHPRKASLPPTTPKPARKIQPPVKARPHLKTRHPSKPKPPVKARHPSKAQPLPKVPEEALPARIPPPPLATANLAAPRLSRLNSPLRPLVDPQEIESEWRQAQGRFNRYAALIRAKIEQAKDYPLAAREMSIQGVVTVQFSLSPAGKLLTVRLVRSSGSKLLDEAALRAVKKAAPFPKAPYPFDQKPRLTFEVSLSFRLQ